MCNLTAHNEVNERSKAAWHRDHRGDELHHDDFTVYEGPPATGKLIAGGINFRGDRGDARVISGPVKTGGAEDDVQSRVCTAFHPPDVC